MTSLLSIPNILTVTRIFVTPLLVSFLLTSGHERALLGAALFLAASLTDALDGYLARKKKQITTLGKLLDPIADKLLNCAVFIALVELRMAPAWIVYIIIAREVLITALRVKALQKKIVIEASWIGKLKMLAQTCTIVLLILGRNYLGEYSLLGKASLWFVLILTIWSGVSYVVKFIKSDPKNLPVSQQTTIDPVISSLKKA
ncbi:MAG: CDP-diacylglycerol--glycerol-3-phosphate 3-phosphatidyltransferase [Candidatus Fischerbacteria bacterium RBG_13_37_8]|uniref:CDP-diacylglycerol--glycerol-3-phosphate 3-phosphatidyltransferase n=1 Tax=Candidatus Fischerbacteria bacterium RBG_13_37_8 TaxID=1817863 RepID=A0A1F5VJ58_9BACT|nr:MAG: CDP-diacylglycerol--glycerol-3-phosphate 3-phosphatidyltransferase [Candidatus Fischerbacteria bacterium RBG_13_37_8]